MSKIVLSNERCIGCGACISVAPESFTFNDEGRTTVINDTVTDEAIEASEMCPVSAITIETCHCKEGEACTCGDDCSCGDECQCNKE